MREDLQDEIQDTEKLLGGMGARVTMLRYAMLLRHGGSRPEGLLQPTPQSDLGNQLRLDAYCGPCNFT